MKIVYEKQFLKDLKGLDSKISERLKKIIIELQGLIAFSEIRNNRKMVGYKNYYRIRIWEYRLWFKLEKDALIFQRFASRGTIYKVFP